MKIKAFYSKILPLIKGCFAFMDIASYAHSKAFTEASIPFNPTWANFYSIKGRLYALRSLFTKLLILPFALLAKGVKTFFRLLGFFLSVVSVFCTLGRSSTLRRFLEKRTHRLALDFVDWIFYPLAVLTCIAKHLLAIIVHPKIQYNL